MKPKSSVDRVHEPARVCARIERQRTIARLLFRSRRGRTVLGTRRQGREQRTHQQQGSMLQHAAAATRTNHPCIFRRRIETSCKSESQHKIGFTAATGAVVFPETPYLK